MTAGTREWDAGTYDRVSGPQLDWAGAVIARLALGGDETVLDAGCGSGRVTELLVDALPRGAVIAVDGSAAMIEQARQRLGARARMIHADLLELDLDEEVDAVFSNAVFHWVPDPDRLFARLNAALRPGGRIVAQCGGEGNVAGFMAALAEVCAREPFATDLAGFDPHRFASAEETERQLEAAGFERVECWLEPQPTRVPEPREFVRSVCIGAYSERLAEQHRGALLDAVMERLGDDPEFGYVRLNISARKPA